ncbi:hypothetical protein FRB95_000995 [Tulasnella sp. JGI-2019a]|nr:hypothetical protein FRB95_000995 [Tulasnella sp. JGI-2019a]
MRSVTTSKNDLLAVDRPTDVKILNYALTLEYLEGNFYSGALAKLDAPAFEAAGFHRGFEHGSSSSQLMKPQTQPSSPAPSDSPQMRHASMASLTHILSPSPLSLWSLRVLVSQPTSAPPRLSPYLTAAGSILTTEARHASWVSSAVNEGSLWSGALDVPLDFN